VVPTGRPQSLQFFIKSTHSLLANTPVSVYEPTQSNNPEAYCLTAACLSNQQFPTPVDRKYFFTIHNLLPRY